MDVVLVVFRTGTVHLVGQRVELGLQGRQMAGDLIKPHPELQDVLLVAQVVLLQGVVDLVQLGIQVVEQFLVVVDTGLQVFRLVVQRSELLYRPVQLLLEVLFPAGEFVAFAPGSL